MVAMAITAITATPVLVAGVVEAVAAAVVAAEEEEEED